MGVRAQYNTFVATLKKDSGGSVYNPLTDPVFTQGMIYCPTSGGSIESSLCIKRHDRMDDFECGTCDKHKFMSRKLVTIPSEMAYRVPKSKRPLRQNDPKKCVICGDQWIPNKPEHKTCSKPCRSELHRRIQRGKRMKP
jgi:hypothetical protein